MTIDTTQFRLRSIEKSQRKWSILNSHNITSTQWRNMYHQHLWKVNKTHMYDNTIIRDIPPELLKTITTY